jgi:hypothetical protein
MKIYRSYSSKFQISLEAKHTPSQQRNRKAAKANITEKYRTFKALTPKGEAVVMPLMPAPAKAET